MGTDKNVIRGERQQNSHYFNAPHKIALDWLPNGSVQTVERSGTYTIGSIDTPSSGLKVLKIIKPNSNYVNPVNRVVSQDYYYVSYRRPVGFNSDLEPGITRGANINIWNGITDLQTFIVDTTPGSISGGASRPNGYFYSADVYDAALSDGSSFSDNQIGLAINQLSHTDDSVTVRINLGETTCARYSPRVRLLSPGLYRGTSGSTAQWKFSVSTVSQYNPNCPEDRFTASLDQLPASWNSSFDPQPLVLRPGESRDLTVAVTSPTTAPVSRNTLKLVITSDQGVRYDNLVSVDYNIGYSLRYHLSGAPGGVLNLIGVPLYTSIQPAELLNTLTAGSCSEISYQHPDRSWGDYLRYSSSSTSLNEISAGKGYLIKCDRAVDLVLQAQEALTVTPRVQPGWQFVSSPKDTGTSLSSLPTADQFLEQLSTANNLNCPEIRRWATPSQSWESHTQGSQENNFQIVEERGYAVRCESTSPPQAFTCTSCAADIWGANSRKDKVVTILDYSKLSSCFRKTSQSPEWQSKSCNVADIDGSGIVDQQDANCLTSQFGQKCQ